MYTSRVAVLGVIACLLLCGSPDVYAGPDFQGLGHLAGGTSSGARSVSADGSVIVGDASYYEEPPSGGLGGMRYFEAFRWTSADGMAGLGLPTGRNESRATGVSGDGTTIVGGADTTGQFSTDSEAFRWTAAEGLVRLDFGLYSNWARGVSANGGVIVGGRQTAPPNPGRYPYYSKGEAVRWSASTGAVVLSPLGFDTGFSAVSADGGVMVGSRSQYSLIGSTSEAIRWTEAEGILGLGHLPGATRGGAADVSSDGLVIVGSERFGTNLIASIYYEAFRWTSGGGMVGLGWLAGWDGSTATAVSGDGSIVVGNLFMDFPPVVNPDDPPAPLDAAFIWKESVGMLILKDFLLARGVDGLDGWTLTEVTDISADGLTVVGMGINPAGQEEAWMATIPEPSTLVLLAVGGLAALRRTRSA